MRILFLLAIMVGHASAQTSTSELEKKSKLSMNIDAFSEASDSTLSADTLSTWADLNTYYQLTEND